MDRDCLCKSSGVVSALYRETRRSLAMCKGRLSFDPGQECNLVTNAAAVAPGCSAGASICGFHSAKSSRLPATCQLRDGQQ